MKWNNPSAGKYKTRPPRYSTFNQYFDLASNREDVTPLEKNCKFTSYEATTFLPKLTKMHDSPYSHTINNVTQYDKYEELQQKLRK